MKGKAIIEIDNDNIIERRRSAMSMKVLGSDQ